MKEQEKKQQAECGCPYCEGSGENETPIFCRPCNTRTLTCQSCGKPVAKGQKTCPACGAPVKQPAKASK